MATERIIGIDFGTSTSVIRIKRYNGNQPVDDRLHTDKVVFDSRTTVPTLIRQSSKGRYYGYEAEKLGRGDEQFKGFKVNLESEIPPLREQARELTKEFFRYLYDVYSSQSEGGHLGDPDDRERTIVSYPVKWSRETRDFMLQAARDAKFKNVEGMDEAQAAIYAVTVQNESQLTQKGYLPSGRATNILLIDMGAGTTDLVLCKYTPGSAPDIVCTWPVGGEVLFGGQEMEKILRSYIGCYLDKDDPMSERLINNLGDLAFKSWKENTVSKTLLHNEAVEEFAELDNLADMAGIEVAPFRLDRTEMNVIAHSYLSQFPQLVNGCLNEASKKGVRRGDIDLVIMTGGHSQWYFVKEMLLDKQLIDLPKIREDRGRILDTALPQETVALGMVFSPIVTSVTAKIKGDSFQHSNVNRQYDSDTDRIAFKMQVEEVFSIEEGLVVCGHGTQGVLKVGDSIKINGKGNTWASAQVKDIQYKLKSDINNTVHAKEASAGMGIGIVLWDIHTERVPADWKGMYLIGPGRVNSQSTPNTVSKHQDLSENKEQTFDLKTFYSNKKFACIGMLDREDVILKPNNVLFSQNNEINGKSRIVSVINKNEIFALRSDGTVYTNSDIDLSSWNDIIQIDASHCHVVGLRRDGRVLAKSNRYAWNGCCDTNTWTDIVSIACTKNHTIGLRKDGMVYVCGYFNKKRYNNIQNTIKTWRNIVSVCGVDDDGIFGLKSDGTVVYVSDSNSPEYWQNVTTWKNIVKLEGNAHTKMIAGVEKSGSVKMIGYSIKSKVKAPNDTISVSCGYEHIVFLRKDGSVFATGNNKYGQCNTSQWRDVIAIQADHNKTYAIRKNGDVLTNDWSTQKGRFKTEIKPSLDGKIIFNVLK